MPYLDKELCDPHLARGMTRIRDDVQSDLGPYLLQFPSGRRLFLARWHHRWLDGGRQFLRKDNGRLGSRLCVPGIRRRTVLARLWSEYGGCVSLSLTR